MTEFRCPSIPQWISEFYPHHRLGLNDAIETCVSGQVTPLVAAFTCERHSSPRYALTSAVPEASSSSASTSGSSICPWMVALVFVDENGVSGAFRMGLATSCISPLLSFATFCSAVPRFLQGGKCLPSTPLFLKIPQVEYKPTVIICVFNCFLVCYSLRLQLFRARESAHAPILSLTFTIFGIYLSCTEYALFVTTYFY